MNLKSLDLRDPTTSDAPAPVGVFPGVGVIIAVALITGNVSVTGGLATQQGVVRLG